MLEVVVMIHRIYRTYKMKVLQVKNEQEQHV